MKTMTETILIHGMRQPNAAAIINDEKIMTYGEFRSRLFKTIQQLSKLKEGSVNPSSFRVGVYLENSEAFLLLFLATAHIGGLAIPYDLKWTPDQLENTILATRPDVIFTTLPLKNRIRASVDVYAVEEWLSIVSPTEALTETAFLHSNPYTDFYLGFTSGTTGLPKGFKRHQVSWTKSFDISSPLFNIRAQDVIAAPGPFVHSLSLYAACHALYVGAAFVLFNHFDPKQVLETFNQYGATVTYLVPTMLEALLMQEVPLTKPMKWLSSGDKLQPYTIKKIREKWPCSSIYEFYGTSETSFISWLDHGGQEADKQLSVGRPFPTVELKLENKKDGTGELWVKSPMLFSGYDQNPTATAAVLRNGWYCTGDLARIDQEGALYLLGREKNRLISGGLNIYPEEIERVIKDQFGLTAFVIVGIPDDYWGEKVTLVLDEQEELCEGEERFLQKLSEKLPRYQLPKQILRLTSLPMTTSGKVARERVLQLAMRQLEGQP
ncbi:AMP-binding protein [Pullulanibacillus sp. KACC 23026]|uniref:AMP-binding protein n=1 Tax=Pullulanibacillus sp. KACC 23026 TaxID=3028315 RepID=UPI0023AEAF1B|nr:AMP-binding protein [Pullulanibacillus sp. KACC 23026]WEG14356.1 AMP-binding protein [Pullulanibacillus sp. KACC 23026]